MRQYQVPQFITIEDKIVGPLTIRQFIYLSVAAGLVVIFYYVFTFTFFVIVAAPIGLLALALAFVKVNGIPFVTMLTNMANYFFKPNLYVWKQLPPKKKSMEPDATKPAATVAKIPKLSESKLQDLAWSLDIKKDTSEQV
ncbi:MAG: PrgI family protein [Candidatus Sungbacteria bacterium]|nr:PrgI family protein [Candidatus Sungbacteria bacterium]